jgi:hypothetical protein
MGCSKPGKAARSRSLHPVRWVAELGSLGIIERMGQEHTESYAGMTVNERLFVSKLMDDFDIPPALAK